jgi:hypothetical protein
MDLRGLLLTCDLSHVPLQAIKATLLEFSLFFMNGGLTLTECGFLFGSFGSRHGLLDIRFARETPTMSVGAIEVCV